MIDALLSGDLPRSRVLGALLALILATLAAAPLLFSGAQAINTAAKICVFVVLVASYDLLLGYTGIVSFAHTMFYGLGGYGVGLALFLGALRIVNSPFGRVLQAIRENDFRAEALGYRTIFYRTCANCIADHQEDVQHDGEGERGVRTGVAQPQ